MTIEWKISTVPVAYEEALNFMQMRVQAIAQEQASSCVWFLEHPSLYTAGTSTQPQDILTPLAFPLHTIGRGGHVTYHGPGQCVVYVMLNLKHWQCDLHWYVRTLEQWIINSLQNWHIKGYRKAGYPGIWVKKGQSEHKIAAIGVRIQRWVTFHGLALNIHPNLDHFKAIVPCGIEQHGVTSLQELGLFIPVTDVIKVLIATFEEVF